MRRAEFKVGDKLWRLTVVGTKDKVGNKRRYQLVCDCDCGTKGIEIYAGDLKAGNRKSCGCLKREGNKSRDNNKAFVDRLVLTPKHTELINLTKDLFRAMDGVRRG